MLFADRLVSAHPILAVRVRRSTCRTCPGSVASASCAGCTGSGWRAGGAGVRSSTSTRHAVRPTPRCSPTRRGRPRAAGCLSRRAGRRFRSWCRRTCASCARAARCSTSPKRWVSASAGSTVSTSSPPIPRWSRSDARSSPTVGRAPRSISPVPSVPVVGRSCGGRTPRSTIGDSWRCARGRAAGRPPRTGCWWMVPSRSTTPPPAGSGIGSPPPRLRRRPRPSPAGVVVPCTPPSRPSWASRRRWWRCSSRWRRWRPRSWPCWCSASPARARSRSRAPSTR
jgi:hypothetical protein